MNTLKKNTETYIKNWAGKLGSPVEVLLKQKRWKKYHFSLTESKQVFFRKFCVVFFPKWKLYKIELYYLKTKTLVLFKN